MGKEALVVPREVLFKDGSFEGFMPLAEKDFLDIISKNHRYHPRGDELENNTSLLQIIPYVWLVNQQTKQAFLYRRVKNKKNDGEFVETRYLGEYSGGVGGHIDSDTEKGTFDPIRKAMMRELREEVELSDMQNHPDPKLIGYIKDDSNTFNKVHFGILAVAHVNGRVKGKSKEGLAEGRFYPPEEIERIISAGKAENWTRISWPHVKNYILSNG